MGSGSKTLLLEKVVCLGDRGLTKDPCWAAPLCVMLAVFSHSLTHPLIPCLEAWGGDRLPVIT